MSQEIKMPDALRDVPENFADGENECENFEQRLMEAERSKDDSAKLRVLEEMLAYVRLTPEISMNDQLEVAEFVYRGAVRLAKQYSETCSLKLIVDAGQVWYDSIPKDQDTRELSDLFLAIDHASCEFSRWGLGRPAYDGYKADLDVLHSNLMDLVRSFWPRQRGYEPPHFAF